MAVSGVTTFTVTRDGMIKTILRNLGAIGSGETPSPEDYTNCSEALNILIKAIAKQGCPLWVTQELVLPLVGGVGVYPIGPTAGYVQSVAVVSGGTDYTDGTWEAVGGTTGTAASGTYTTQGGVVTGMTVVVAGDSYTSAPTSYTLSGVGAGDAASFSATLVGLTMSKPLKILLEGSFLRDASGNDATLMQISRQEYNIQGNKSSLGIPNQFYYDVGLVNGNVYLLNVPSDSARTVHLQIQRQFYDIVGTSDNFDFPQEWFQWLKWGGSAELAAEYGVSAQMIPYYDGKASMFAGECFGFSVEEASVLFTADTRGGR